MAELAKVKDSRSRAKAKLTSAARQLTSNANLSDTKSLLTSLQQAHTEFIDLHCQFSELVFESEDETLGVVGGLDLDQYLKRALEPYHEAKEIYARLLADSLHMQINVAIDKADVILQQLESCGSNPDIYAEADKLLGLCNGYYKQLFAVGYQGNLLSKLSQCISNLDVKVLRSREYRSTVVSAPNFSRGSEPLSLTTTRTTNTCTDIHSPPIGGSAVRGAAGSRSLPGVSDPAASGSGAVAYHSSKPVASSTLEYSVVSAYSSNDTRRLSSMLNSTVLGGGGVDNAQLPANLESRFKKSPPPTFSGNRREWAEFRAVWQRYGALEFSNDEHRAWALKECLKGKALEYVRAIFVTQPNAYARMWQRLDSVYSDISLSVQAAYDDLKKLKQVREDDPRAMVKFVTDVEVCYSQLGEVNQLESITMTHVDDLCELLPISVQKDWIRQYNSLSVDEKIHPFSSFMLFLEAERSTAIRLSERSNKAKTVTHQKTVHHVKAQPDIQDNIPIRNVPSVTISCLVHNKLNAKHNTANCSKFLSMSVPERLGVLKKAHACFRCFGLHLRAECPSANVCSGSGPGSVPATAISIVRNTRF
jgi:hypothetical protein